MLNENVHHYSGYQTGGSVPYAEHKHEVLTHKHSLRHGAVDHLDDARADQTGFKYHFA
jgi:hypothetical protein